MKSRILEEMHKPVAWGGSPDLTNKETIGIVIVIGIIAAVARGLGLL